jgi:hypothetical protein
MKTPLLSLALAAFVITPVPALAAGKGQPLTVPDFTTSDAIPAGAKHDWNLGPTGLRGWMFCDKMVTTNARQIYITKVEKGSPAEGVLAVGDVLLGVGGKPFSYDPRREFGKALTVAESEAGGGKFVVTRWRGGRSEAVVVKLPVLGSYSATAPFDCAKSKRILEQGCQALAEKVAKSSHQEDPIVRSFNALALLASGNPTYLPLVKKEAQWAAGYSSRSMQTWHYGYVMLLLSEYRNLSAEDIKPLLPAIYQAIIEPAPSGEMFADSIRVEGLRLLAKHRIKEGMSACVKYTRDQNPWASEHRTPELMKILLSYGAHAKSVIPELTKIGDYFEKEEKNFPKELMLLKAKSVRETIRAIEASTDSSKLIRLNKT